MSAHCPASKVVLLIHQKSATRRLLTSILSAHGHQVVGAADAKTGLHGLVEHHPDVALVDASAVDANGVPLCQRIRQCCPIPIMLIAADSELASTTMLAMNCADAVILWPEPPEVLLATLDTLLGATRSLQLASDGRSKRADGTTIIVDPHQRRIFCPWGGHKVDGS